MGIYDRMMAGLLGTPSDYGGLLSAEDQKAAQRDGQMAIAMQLLQAGGYSNQPVNLGQAIGSGVMAGRQAQAGGLDAALQAQLLKSQIARNGKQNLPTSAEEFEYRQKLTPEQQTQFDAMRAKSGPAAIQEFEYFKKLSPEDQGTYKGLQRQPTVPKVVMIGNVPHLVDPITGVKTPLSTLENETAGAGAVKQSEGYGSATGKILGEVAGGIQKKGSDAVGTEVTLDMAEPLIEKATGSAGGALIDSGARVFGKATEGDKAIAQLKVLQANLMTTMPRMEGPQSDRDVDLYREAAGQIGDPTVPAELKKAAVQTIRMLQRRYQERAGTKPPTSTSSDKVVNWDDL
jgi:hypothetical protein